MIEAIHSVTVILVGLFCLYKISSAIYSMFEGDTLLHHLIFEIISYVLIAAAITANIFSKEVAKWLLMCTLIVCVMWVTVNVIILGIRLKKDEIERGFGLEPMFLLFPLIMLRYIIF